MGRRKKKAAGDKDGGVAEPASAAAPKPRRARNSDHLKNKKLHGLEFGLTQRNNILIDCWAADRVPREVIIACFENAGIYPPEASANLLSPKKPSRNSRRIEKVQAVQELSRISNDISLTTDEKLLQSSQLLEDIMELDKYEQTSAESLCPLKRKKKKNKSASRKGKKGTKVHAVPAGRTRQAQLQAAEAAAAAAAAAIIPKVLTNST